MDFNQALDFIREWREIEGLIPLSFHEEMHQVKMHLLIKNIDLPNELRFNNEVFYKNEGIYMNVINKSEEKIDNLYPFDPNDKRIFNSKTLKCKVVLTGNLKIDGTYYVSKLGEGYQTYPELGCNLEPSLDDIEDTKNENYLYINKSSWAEIKNFMVDKFINSYPWNKMGDKNSNQVREDVENFTKSKNKGLAQLIILERNSGGIFINTEEFINRMNVIYDSFPWFDFSECLDFSY